MWDLLFGKPKKRYYKPKNKRIDKQGKVVNKKVPVSDKNNIWLQLKSSEIVNEKSDITKKETEKIIVPKNNISIKKKVIDDYSKQKAVANIKIYDNLVSELKQKIDNVFVSAFLAQTDKSLVIRSWFMKDEQSLVLSKIFINTNHYLFDKSKSKIKSYAILDLDEDKLLFILKHNSYQFTMMLNSDKVSVGYLINIIKPIIEKHIKNN